MADPSRFSTEPALLFEEFGQRDRFQSVTGRAFEQARPTSAYGERRGLWSGVNFDRFSDPVQFEPKKPIGAQRESIRLFCDCRKFDISEHLDRNHSFEIREVEI